jgi:hypothetical protein
VSQPHFGAKCEDETHTPKVTDLESSGTPKCLGFDSKGRNTLHLGVLSVIGKVLKCRCPKWPRIGHLDIFNPSYGQKKGRESNWQFDSRPLKVGNRPLFDVCRRSAIGRWKALEERYNFDSDLTSIEVGAGSCECPKSQESNPGQFQDSSLGVSGKSVIRMRLSQSNAKNTIWGKVMVSPECGLWWVLCVKVPVACPST